MNSTLSLPDLLQAAETTVLPNAASGEHNHKFKLSFTIVNNKNGRRIVFNRELTKALSLTNSVDIMPLPTEGYILAASVLPISNAIHCNLHDMAGGKTAYSSSTVSTITACFKLDYSKHTSLSFYDVTIDKLNDSAPIAIIKVDKTSNPSAETDIHE